MPVTLDDLLGEVPEARRDGIALRARAIAADNRELSDPTTNGGARPPRLAQALLTLAADPKDRDSVVGDFREAFGDRIAWDGLKRARALYAIEVGRAFPSLLVIRFARLIAPTWLSIRLQRR